MSAQLSYRILNRYDLNRIKEEKQHLVDTFYILDYNAAFITKYIDGTGIIFPPVSGSDEGLYFEDIQEMEKMIESRCYPVKGTGSFNERYKKEIINIDTSLPFFLEKLSKFLSFEIVLTEKPDYLVKLNEAINKAFSKKAVKEELYDLLVLYFSELARRRVNGEWKYFPEWSLNMEYSLEIKAGDQSCAPAWHVISALNLIDGKTLLFNSKEVLDSATYLTPYAEERYVEPYYIDCNSPEKLKPVLNPNKGNRQSMKR